MSVDLLPAASTFTRRRLLVLALVAAAAALVVVALRYGAGRSPDWALFLRQPAMVHVHVAAALIALLVGSAQLIGVKGTGLHRVIGWSWVLAMATTAISSLFLRQINDGAFSLIHLLSGWTLIALPMGLWHARRGRALAHGRTMAGLFVGGLIIAGAFTFLPGRLMWAVFFG